MSDARSRVATAAVLGTATTALLAPPAGAAAATSGMQLKEAGVYLNNGQQIDACMTSEVDTYGTSVDMTSRAFSKQPGTGCSSAATVPTGYLGAFVYGYKNGSFCGVAGPTYSYAAASSWVLNSRPCSWTSRANYFTRAGSMFYKGPSWQQNNGYKLYVHDSPMQTG